MHNWRAARFKLRKSFIREYFRHFPMSAPQDDWDDRNLLYSLYTYSRLAIVDLTD